MDDGIMLIIGDDGIARSYDDTYDITIHCESQEEQNEVKRRLTVPQWIPCKEHPPLFDFTDVLLLYHDKRCGCEDDYYIMQAYTVRGQWRPALRIDDSDMESLEPVAWCELSEPYKED